MGQTDSSYNEVKRYILEGHGFRGYSNWNQAHENLDIAGGVDLMRKERGESKKRKTVQVQAGNPLCFYFYLPWLHNSTLD